MPVPRRPAPRQPARLRLAPPRLGRRNCPPRLRRVVARRPVPSTPCHSPTRRVPEGRKGRRWPRPPCATRRAPRRSYGKTSAALASTARQAPDVQEALPRRPSSRISPAGSPSLWRRSCGQGVVSCGFDGHALPTGSQKPDIPWGRVVVAMSMTRHNATSPGGTNDDPDSRGRVRRPGARGAPGAGVAALTAHGFTAEILDDAEPYPGRSTVLLLREAIGF